MTAGVHCAHFELRKLGNRAMVGVAGPGFDPAAGGEANESAEGWLMATTSGRLWHGGSRCAVQCFSAKASSWSVIGFEEL